MLHKMTLSELSAGLHARDFSSVELTQCFIDRIHELDKPLNSFITVTEEQAFAEAKQADARYGINEAGPLTGIPLAHKDIFCTQGVKTSCGSKMLDNFIAPYDATVVTLCKQAGMVTLGKTNMDEFAMGSSNETSFYGHVKNPWHSECVPGGSSGGSAVAVAARLCPATTGTDTGGSIRQPAAFCGITGLKPTYGRVSRYGMIAFASSLDQGGPMAKTAEDCAMLLNVMAGFDEKDSTSAQQPVPDYTASLHHPLQGLRIGLPKAFFNVDLSPQISDLTQQAAQQLEQLGASLIPIELPNIGLSVPTYYVIASAECSSNLARYDGVRYGYRCEQPKNLDDLYKRSRSEGFGAEVKRRIMIGTYALSAGYYDAYYGQAQKVRHLIRDDFVKVFDTADVILAPTTPTAAFNIGEKIDDPVSMYLADIYTIGVNLAGLPGMSLPIGFLEGKPIGMQLIGNYFAEARLLNVAHQYQQHTDWHQRCPENY